MFSLSRPFVFGIILTQFSSRSEQTIVVPIFYCFLLTLITSSRALCGSQATYRLNKTGQKLQESVQKMIYEKVSPEWVQTVIFMPETK